MIYELNFEPDSLFIGNLFEALQNNNKDQRELLFNCYTKLKTKNERVIVLNELARISIQQKNSSLLKEIFYALIIIKSEKDVLDEHNLIKIKQEIMSEDFIFLLASSQFDDYKSDLFQVFKNFNLIQSINNEKLLLKQAVACNNHKFLASFVFELDEWYKEFHNDEYLIKESCKHLECFKIFYFSKPTACFQTNNILKHCLENKYTETFEFILKQFNHLSNDENDHLKQLIIDNLTWKSESYSSLLHYVILLTSYSASEIIHLFAVKIIKSYISINNDLLDLIQNNSADYMPILKYFLENKLINTNEYKLNSNKIIQNECFTNNDLIVKELNNLKFEITNEDQTTFEMIIKRNDSHLMDIYLNQLLKDECNSFDYKYLKLINSVKMIQSVFKYLVKIKSAYLESYLEYFIEICIDNQLIYGLIQLLNDLNEKKYLKIIIASIDSFKLMILIRNSLDLFKSIKLFNDQNVLHYIAENLNIIDFVKAVRIFNYSLVDINDTDKQTPLDIAFQRFNQKEILINDILNDHYSGKFIFLFINYKDNFIFVPKKKKLKKSKS